MARTVVGSTFVNLLAEARVVVMTVGGANPLIAVSVSLRFAEATETEEVVIVVVGDIETAEDSEDSGEVNEGILVGSDGLGRLWMWKRDVVATEIITSIHRVLVHLGHLIGVVLVLRLPDLCNTLRKVHLFELGPGNEGALLSALVVFVAAVKLLHLIAHDRPLGGDFWSHEATKIVVFEKYFFFFLHILGELGVD